MQTGNHIVNVYKSSRKIEIVLGFCPSSVCYKKKMFQFGIFITLTNKEIVAKLASHVFLLGTVLSLVHLCKAYLEFLLLCKWQQALLTRSPVNGKL